MEIKSLKEQLSLQEQIYENEKKIEFLKREKEINFLLKAHEDTLKRYGFTVVGIGLAYYTGFNSVYSDEIRQMAQTVCENRVGILALVNLLRQFVNFGQSNTQNNANTHTTSTSISFRKRWESSWWKSFYRRFKRA